MMLFNRRADVPTMQRIDRQAVRFTVSGCLALVVCLLAGGVPATAQAPVGNLADDYAKQVRPLLKKYCFSCHDAKDQKGDLDLERFSSLEAIRKDFRPWQHLIEQVEVGEMPPKKKPQPAADERKVILTWVRNMLDAEARARAGDPGLVPLRRLSNAEYDATIRDLTGVDLKPTREFPADGAGGEGFTNAGESLSDISPTLFTRYLDAAKDVADHAVLLPDGFRFSPSKTRRDWSDEVTADLRKYYSQFWSEKDGGIHPPISAYLQRTVTHREVLAQGKFEEAAAKPFGLNPKYLRILWQALHDKTPSEPLDTIRAKWRKAIETGDNADAESLFADLKSAQGALWRTATVGDYIRSTDGKQHVQSNSVTESLSRQVPFDPPGNDVVPLRVPVKALPGQSTVTIYLAARETGSARSITWQRPRFEGNNKPVLLLRDYPSFGPAFEAGLSSAFARTEAYLSAVAELAHTANASPDAIAAKGGLDAGFLKQWAKVLAVVPQKQPAQTAGSNKSPASIVAGNSILGRWRSAAADPARRAEADQLAKQVERVLGGPRPDEKDVERAMFDKLVALDSPLFAGVDLAKIAKSAAKPGEFGLPKERFSNPDGDSLIEKCDKVVEIRLPVTLFVGREFVVDAKIDNSDGSRFVRLHAGTSAPTETMRWDGLLLSGTNPAYKRMLAGNEEFRRLFPLFACFPRVIPTDEVVTLKMFHREDEPLLRLFATEEQARQLDRLWAELRMISRQPVAEYDYLPTYMGFTTQDTSKAFQQFFIDRKPKFKQDADDFLKWEEAVIPMQMDALLAFAGKAFRRPLQEKEKSDLRTLYHAVRKKGAGHDEAFRGVLAGILASPSFLFRIEAVSKGREPTPVSDLELATRLSYFLWSSMPDDELRQLAAAGKLRDPQVLAAQTQRMMKDARTRSLAIEFGTQWLHVRGFDDLKEKNETLFPTFDANLRRTIYEESILFFQDLFQSDRPIRSVLDADYTFLNEPLAKHYGIPGVTGPQWRKVDGVRKYGRGGVLGLASVQAKQSGASRTSPVLRGNWVVETLLGEKLPRPPANVPILPDQAGTDKLTTRQMVEQHVSDATCAACHVRIDPFGFAFEKFDPIGRFREKESGGQPVDAKARLRDGTEFDGIEGLREYLLTKKRRGIERLFCQRLLGYALGRMTTLSDTVLIDEMVSELEKNDGRVSAAVLAIVRSRQFQWIRGLDLTMNE